MTELQRPVPLDLRRHDRRQLDSGEPSLDDWLRRFAGQNQREGFASTWVIADPDDVVVGYASIAMSGIDRSAAPQALAKGAPNPVPVLLVARLAVDQSVTRLGIGTALVFHALATAVELNPKAACKAVVVNSLHARARSWWERFGFHPFDPDSLDLYLLTSEVKATLETRR